MRDTKDLLDFEIYPHLDRAESVRDLEPQASIQEGSRSYLIAHPVRLARNKRR